MSSSKPSDQRFTPEYVLDVVRKFGGGQIDTDPCTTTDNITRATTYWTVDDDGLTSKWHGVTWVNPPYSRGELAKWMTQCYMRANHARVAESPLDVLALIPSDLGSKAGQNVAVTCDALCFVRGRLAFDSPQGVMKCGAKQPSILAYWGDRAARFKRYFDALGTVWVR